LGCIDVNPPGDTIVIVAQCNHKRVEGTDTIDIHDIRFTKSVNGGETFEPMEIVVSGDSFPCDGGERRYAESPAIHLGSNGYLFVECLAKDTILYPGEEWQKVVTMSEDFGETWTKAQVLHRPEGWEYAANWWAVIAPGVVVNNVPHTPVYIIDPSGSKRVIEYHLDGGEWVYSIASPPKMDSIVNGETREIFGSPEYGSMGADAEGRLYIVFRDLDHVAGMQQDWRWYNAFVVGSPNGIDWSWPIRVSNVPLPAPDTNYVVSPEMAENVGNVGYMIYEDGDWGGNPDPSAVWFSTFSPDSIFKPENFPPKITDVTNYGNTYQTTGTYDIEAKIHDETGLTETTLFYAIGEDTTKVPMNLTGDEIYTAPIPAQEVGTRIEYWVKAVDTDANEAMVPGSFDAGYSILVLPGGVVAYDDGIAIDGISEPWGNGFLSVRFSPTEAAVETLTTVRLFIWSNPDSFIVHLNPDDGSGKPNPDVELITPIEAMASDSGAWMDVNVEEEFIPTEDFHIRIEFPLHDRPLIGADKLCDCDRSWMNYSGWWWAHPSDWGLGDLLIRAIMPGYGVGVEEGRTSIYRLSQNLPNPILKSTTIEFAIPKKEHVNLAVYNVAGQKVKTLVDGDISPGSYTINWNGKDKNGRRLAAGVYFYRMEAGKYVSTRKLVFLR
jgi:hypothetical protein